MSNDIRNSDDVNDGDVVDSNSGRGSGASAMLTPATATATHAAAHQELAANQREILRLLNAQWPHLAANTAPNFCKLTNACSKIRNTLEDFCADRRRICGGGGEGGGGGAGAVDTLKKVLGDSSLVADFGSAAKEVGMYVATTPDGTAVDVGDQAEKLGANCVNFIADAVKIVIDAGNRRHVRATDAMVLSGKALEVTSSALSTVAALCATAVPVAGVIIAVVLSIAGSILKAIGAAMGTQKEPTMRAVLAEELRRMSAKQMQHEIQGDLLSLSMRLENVSWAVVSLVKSRRAVLSEWELASVWSGDWRYAGVKALGMLGSFLCNQPRDDVASAHEFANAIAQQAELLVQYSTLAIHVEMHFAMLAKLADALGHAAIGENIDRSKAHIRREVVRTFHEVIVKDQSKVLWHWLVAHKTQHPDMIKRCEAIYKTATGRALSKLPELQHHVRATVRVVHSSTKKSGKATFKEQFNKFWCRFPRLDIHSNDQPLPLPLKKAGDKDRDDEEDSCDDVISDDDVSGNDDDASEPTSHANQRVVWGKEHEEDRWRVFDFHFMPDLKKVRITHARTGRVLMPSTNSACKGKWSAMLEKVSSNRPGRYYYAWRFKKLQGILMYRFSHKFKSGNKVRLTAQTRGSGGRLAALPDEESEFQLHLAF